MWLFAIIVLTLTLHIPIYFGPDSTFIGLRELWNLNGILPVFSIVILVIDLFFYIHLKYRLRGPKELSVKIIKIKGHNADALSFLASYFIPLVSFNVTQGSHQIVLLLLFVAIGIMYVKGNMFHLNPSLLLLGFRLYEVSLEMRDKKIRTDVLVMSQDLLSVNDRIRYSTVTNELWVCKKSPTNKS